MARPNDASREGALLIELKAVGPEFPLYGDFTLTDGRRFDPQMLENRGAVVGQSLLDRLDLRLGDEVKIGNVPFQIRGVMNADPGGGTGFRLGPRVFIAKSAIEETGLIGFGSRARYRVLLSTHEGSLDLLVTELRSSLKNNLINIRTYKDSEQNISEQYTRSENYLSLVGLVILVLGGIGIANVTRVFIEQKKKAIAVLKCVGATSSKITIVYVAQVIALGVAGSAFGIVLAKLALIGIGSILCRQPAGKHESNTAHRNRDPGSLTWFACVATFFRASPASHPAHQTKHAATQMRTIRKSESSTC